MFSLRKRFIHYSDNSFNNRQMKSFGNNENFLSGYIDTLYHNIMGHRFSSFLASLRSVDFDSCFYTMFSVSFA